MTSVVRDARLHFVARSEPIAAPSDLLRHVGPGGFVWLDGDTGFVTSGVAATVPSADAMTVLDAVTHVRADGAPAASGPRLVGALPFASDGHLVLPARIVAREPDGRAWSTTIEDVDVPLALHVAPSSPAPFTVSRTTEPEAWRDMVERALVAIERRALDKVVLSRDVIIEAAEAFDVIDVLRALRATQPGCTVYASDGFVGASPELLVRRFGSDVESLPVAGTAVADGDAASLRALAESVKDHREHRFVVDAIVDALGTRCVTLDAGAAPEVAVFGHVAHLATRVHGRLREPAPSALELARLLHPTPAVGGTPRVAAVDAIRALEGFDRGRYAAPVGWVDARGDGEWAIALRGAELDGTRARLVAGAGIVEGSDPDAEWAETQAKLEPMLRALVRP
jgi:menaquinone-specific isochorismate synthase